MVYMIQRVCKHLKGARSPESFKESAKVKQSFYGGWDRRSDFKIRTELEWRYENGSTAGHCTICFDIVEAGINWRNPRLLTSGKTSRVTAKSKIQNPKR